MKIITAEESNELRGLRRQLKSHFETVFGEQGFDKTISKLELERQCEQVLAAHALARLRELDGPASLEAFLNHNFRTNADAVRRVKSWLRKPRSKSNASGSVE